MAKTTTLRGRGESIAEYGDARLMAVVAADYREALDDARAEVDAIEAAARD